MNKKPPCLSFLIKRQFLARSLFRNYAWCFLKFDSEGFLTPSKMSVTKSPTVTFLFIVLKIPGSEGTTLPQCLLSQVMTLPFEAKFSPWLQWEMGESAFREKSVLHLSKVFYEASLSLGVLNPFSAKIGSQMKYIEPYPHRISLKTIILKCTYNGGRLSHTSTLPDKFLDVSGQINSRTFHNTTKCIPVNVWSWSFINNGIIVNYFLIRYIHLCSQVDGSFMELVSGFKSCGTITQS